MLQNHAVAGVIADGDCGALQFARVAGAPYFGLFHSQEKGIAFKNSLRVFAPDVVITNFHRIVSLDIVHLYRNKLLSLHYSLLPAFAGMIGAAAVRMVLKQGCKFVGTIAHLVEEIVDAGPIIYQSIMKVAQSTSFGQVMNGVFQGGCLNLQNALQILDDQDPASLGSDNDAPMFPDTTMFSPPLKPDPGLSTECFWQRLK